MAEVNIEHLQTMFRVKLIQWPLSMYIIILQTANGAFVSRTYLGGIIYNYKDLCKNLNDMSFLLTIEPLCSNVKNKIANSTKKASQTHHALVNKGHQKQGLLPFISYSMGHAILVKRFIIVITSFHVRIVWVWRM